MKAPLHRKTHQPTVDEEALEKIAAKHSSDPILPLVLKARGLQKAISYLDTTFMWADGRFHPSYSLAETGRILARSPNIQNQPRGRRASEREMALAVRTSIVPTAGMLLLEADWRAIEALLVGWFAGDADYMRASKLGVHAILASHIIKRPISMSWSDADIREAASELKKLEPYLYDASKVTVHECLTGDHEVLTRNGWRSFYVLSDKEEIAQWGVDGTVEFVVPKITRTTACGDFVSIEGRAVSAVMTHDHRIPFTDGRKRPFRCTTAQELTGKERVPVNGMLAGDDEPLTLQAKLAVAIQADASKGHPNYRVFHLVKERKIARLKKYLDALSVKYSVKSCKCHPGRGYRIGFTWKDREYLGEDWIFKLDRLLALGPMARTEFLAETIEWDGSNPNGGPCKCYLTTEKENADIVQAIAHVTGVEALLRPIKPSGYRHNTMYSVSFNRRQLANLGHAEIKRFRAEQCPVYCVTVPSSYFLVRHRDRVSVTGNTGYGASAFAVARTVGCSVPDARRYQAIYDEMAPKVARWRETTRQQAHKEHRTTNPFGFVSPYWFDVFSWDKEHKEWRHGSQANEVLAFLPQSTGASMLSEVLLLLDELYGSEPDRFSPLAPIHDSVLAEALSNEIDTWASRLRDVMQRPFAELGGLACEVEVKVGTSWASMEPWAA